MLNNKSFNKVVGDSGEELALKFLKDKHYKIIETKYINKLCEIYIIAKHKDILVFIEVKNRTSDYFGLPRESVNMYKQNKIRLVATSYLKSKNLLDNACRFDVIDILNGKITHIEDCF